MAYAIMRTKKRRDLGSVRRGADHHLRAVDTPNADPEGEIVVVAGSDDPRQVTELIRDVTKPLMKRRDAIRCIDVFCGASPEFFAAGGSIRDFERRAMTWAADTFGADNIALAVTHEDETTPHLQMLITPITPDGRLAASHWLDGPKKLEAMQDSFALAMKPLGLKRGVRGSKAKHEEVRHWYADLAPKMRSAELRIAEAEAKLAAAELASADMAKAQKALAADRLALSKMKIQMQNVEEYNAREAKKVSDQEGRVRKATVVLREEVQRVKKLEIAAKEVAAAAKHERIARLATEEKLERVTVKNKELEDDLNVAQNELGSLKRRLRKSPE